MDEQSKDVDLDTQNQSQEGATSEEGNSANEPTDDISKLKEINHKLFLRAKKAEEEAKTLKTKVATPQPPQSDLQTNLEADELRLIARGLSDEEIEKAKILAKGLGVSMAKAIADPLFVAWQKEQKEIERKEKAKLGASKGSGSQEDTIVKSGMTREEHQAAFQKALGN